MLGLIKKLEKRALFYNLQETDETDKIICKIVNHYYKKRMKILIIGDDISNLQRLDELLWTFEQNSFVPHSLNSDYDNCPVIIALLDNLEEILKKTKFNVLFNLTLTKMMIDIDTDLYVEIVTSDERQKTIAREKFSHYKNNNLITSYEYF